jgi:cyclopropane fatty-acyl-phospholipid synthase-like methyltransferase
LDTELRVKVAMTGKSWGNLWRDENFRREYLEPEPAVEDAVANWRAEEASRILDLGFGIGRHVILLARSGLEAFGIEGAREGHQFCETWLAQEGLKAELKVGDIKELPWPDDFFDGVISWNVIYHGTVDDIRNTIVQVRRVLKTECLFLLTLNSTLNNNCGHGEEIERHTYANMDKPDGDHLHHYSDEEEVYRLFEDWEIETVYKEEGKYLGKTYPGSWHWGILVRNSK